MMRRILTQRRNRHEAVPQGIPPTVEERVRLFAALPIDEAVAKVSSFQTGLTTQEANRRLAELGRNTISATGERSMIGRIRKATITSFNMILLVIAVITYITDVVASASPDYSTTSIILVLIFLSSLVAFIQSQRSDNATAELLALITNTATVLRDGEECEISLEEIVPGDVVALSAGDMLPADLRFLTTKDTFVAQGVLTGESYPVEKASDPLPSADAELSDLRNIGFMGTDVISGSASAVVVATGNRTYLGSMAKSLSGDRAQTSFERGVSSISRLLIRMMLLMVPVVLLINGFTKGDWGSALLFSISIAVGLTPEMLPVIMTSTLARGAISMSQHKVIIHSLGAIQTLGEMDVMCSDKTGTLTEDQVELEHYLNLRGEEDSRVLDAAYLNSAFQTGLKNFMDVAIIFRAEANGLQGTLASYTRVDEIPFDFTRRRMSVVLEDEAGNRNLITKGAVAEMLSICSLAELDGKVVPLDAAALQTAQRIYQESDGAGLRTIAVAYKQEVPDIDHFSVADEFEMVLIGFVSFLDPPKASAAHAIDQLREYGVRTVVLTGDSEGVAAAVCQRVGVDTAGLLTGRHIDAMNDTQLQKAAQTCSLFAKLTPAQKERIVRALQANGHTVGYLGDGINDAPPLRQADVGISVDTAVDIAKECADVILLEKDLLVLRDGILEGRRTFVNINKYIKMAASGNFGNMFSVIVASIFLPFLPMLPVQLLTHNLLCDFSQMGIPLDHVDDECLQAPRRWQAQSVRRFMLVLGPVSSIFDILTFAVLWWIIQANTMELAPLFQAGWFVFGTLSQVLVIHMIRTSKIPFLQSMPSGALLASSALVVVGALMIGFTGFATALDMFQLPLVYMPWLAVILLGYLAAVQFTKVLYMQRHGEWI